MFDSSNAPPPYEQPENACDNQNQNRDVELPAYTENDPYSLAERDGEGRDKEGEEGEGGQGEGEREAASPGEGERETAHQRQESIVSSEQDQPTMDTAPLIEQPEA